MCHHAFIYDGRYKNTSSQTNSLIKYVSTDMDVGCKIKFIVIR